MAIIVPLTAEEAKVDGQMSEGKKAPPGVAWLGGD